MKRILLISSLLAVGLIVGCKPSTTEATSRQMDKAQAATKDAAKQIRDYTFEEKGEFVTTMQTQLAELNQTLDDLSAKIEKSNDAVKAEAAPKLAALREQATQLKKQLDDVVNATPSTWSTIKAESEKAYASLKQGMTESRQWLSDKIAP